MIASATHLRTFESYLSAIESGDIVACKMVIAAVARHRRDIERQDTDDFPFVFDEHEAEMACSFYPAALRHSVGKWSGQAFELSPWQVFCVASMHGWKRLDGTRRYRKAHISVARKNGKALALSTLIPTPTGWTTMGEIQPGDMVYGEDGHPVRVIAATEIMTERPCYQMQFSTGETIICDAQHEWKTRMQVVAVGSAGVGREMNVKKTAIRTTESIADTCYYGKRGDRNHSVAVAPAIDGESESLVVSPYTLGAWLGDGTSDSGSITCHYDDREIIERCEADGFVATENSTAQVTTGRWTLQGIRLSQCLKVGLRKIGVLGNKHIPQHYLRTSYGQRLELLRGLMDTDGYVNAKGRCEFCATNRNLAYQTLELVRSLGVKATIITGRATIDGVDKGAKYRVTFSAFRPFIPFHLQRKAAIVPERTSTKTPRSRTRHIVSCKPIDSVPVRCIQVEGGMFLCSEGFVPTHNSTFAAGESLALLYADAEPIAQVFVGATKFDQAKIVFDEAERMLKQSPALFKRSTLHKNNILCDGSYLRPLGSDKAFDGLNPHGVIFDELHEWKEHHRKFYDTMTTGGASRRQPLQITITTAGDQTSLIWKEETKYCRDVVYGDYEDNEQFVFVAELDADDDPLDESVWEKANPNLGISVSLDYLQSQAKKAGRLRTALNKFLRYHANREVSSISSVIDRDKWDTSEGELSDWLTAEFVGGGIDVGGGQDLGATAFCAKWPVGVQKVTEDGEEREVAIYRYEITSRAYIDAKSERDVTQQPWATWLHEGQIQRSEWLMQEMRDDFLEHAGSVECNSFAFDPWNMTLMAEQLEEEGMEAVKMPQRAAQYGEPIEQFLEALADGRITHNGDPVLRWCALNLAVKPGYGGGWMPDRGNSREKIDCIVAVLMAFRMAYFALPQTTWNPADGVSL